MKIGEEIFYLNGLEIVERNYLDVYVYDKWNNKRINSYDIGQVFVPVDGYYGNIRNDGVDNVSNEGNDGVVKWNGDCNCSNLRNGDYSVSNVGNDGVDNVSNVRNGDYNVSNKNNEDIENINCSVNNVNINCSVNNKNNTIHTLNKFHICNKSHIITNTAYELCIVQGKTSPPLFLSEPDLISLMDKNGIGTDATIHEHINKILIRKYAKKVGNLIVPEKLGIGLIKGYREFANEEELFNNKNVVDGCENKNVVVGYDNGNVVVGCENKSSMNKHRYNSNIEGTSSNKSSNSKSSVNKNKTLNNSILRVDKPYMRKKLEIDLKKICVGEISKESVLQEEISTYEKLFCKLQNNIEKFKSVVESVLNEKDDNSGFIDGSDDSSSENGPFTKGGNKKGNLGTKSGKRNFKKEGNYKKEGS
ncbi:dna topoisomerase iii, partial [Vairimorpha apis BRL 01]